MSPYTTDANGNSLYKTPDGRFVYADGGQHVPGHPRPQGSSVQGQASHGIFAAPPAARPAGPPRPQGPPTGGAGMPVPAGPPTPMPPGAPAMGPGATAAPAGPPFQLDASGVSQPSMSGLEMPPLEHFIQALWQQPPSKVPMRRHQAPPRPRAAAPAAPGAPPTRDRWQPQPGRRPMPVAAGPTADELNQAEAARLRNRPQQVAQAPGAADLMAPGGAGLLY